jgi:hypothetical protein
MLKKLRSLFCLGVVALGLYSAFMFAMPYYKFWAFKSDAGDIIHMHVYHLSDMRDNILKKAREYGVPLKEERLDVMLTEEGGYWAKASWSETVNILDFYKKRLDFSFEVP